MWLSGNFLCRSQRDFLFASNVATSTQRKTISFRKLRNIELTEFGKDIELKTADFSGNNAVEHFVKVFNNGMREVLDKHAPSHTKKKSSCVQLSVVFGRMCVAKRERRKADRIWRRTNLTIHRDIHKDKCHLYSKLLAQSKQDYFSRKINECGSDSKRLYGLTNRLLGKNQEPSLPTSDSDTELSNKFPNSSLGRFSRSGRRFKKQIKQVTLNQMFWERMWGLVVSLSLTLRQHLAKRWGNCSRAHHLSHVNLTLSRLSC